MSRRKAATKREILPDSKYNNLVVAKCINVVMWDGKKEVAENIVYGALDKLKKIAKDGNELAAFLEAVDALKPSVEVKGRRVGGATYQVPVEVRPERQQTLCLPARMAAMQCSAWKKSGEAMETTSMSGLAMMSR